MRTHNDTLADLEALASQALELSNHIGFHNPATEEALMEAHALIRSAIHAEKSFDEYEHEQGLYERDLLLSGELAQ